MGIVKTSEEIMKDHCLKQINDFESEFIFTSQSVLKAMEEYANQFKEQPKKSIEERRSDFVRKIEEIRVSCSSGINLIQFIDYWTEHGENAKKMRFEKEKVFDIKKRLERWNRNQKPTTNGTTTSEALNKFITE